MATTKATSAAPTVSAPTAPATPVAAPSLLSFDEIEARMTSVTALGAEGKAYVEKLSELFNKKTGGVIAVEKIPHRIESHACIDKASKRAIILVFNESYIAGPQNTPVTENMPDICNAFKNMHADVTMTQYIVVTPADYECVENMSTHVINAFAALDPNTSLRADQFNRMKLTPTTDLNQVKKFVAQHSPHKVLDRADWGVLINRVMNNERASSYQTQKEPDLRPIIAVTGYTKFIRVNANGLVKYLPIAVITNVTCTIPSTDLLCLALPIVAGCVISQQQWKRVYTTFAKDKPNLGCLFTEPGKKEPKWFSNQEEMNLCCANNIIEIPLLAMDCAEGRARIPGLEKYIINGASAVVDQLNKFFGPASSMFANANQAPIITTFFNYEGTYKTAGQEVDTRNGDYINMFSETKDFNRCQRALSQALSPAQHIQDISSIYGDDAVVPLYRVHTIVFNSMLINVLASLVSSVVNYSSEACVNQNVDMAALLAQFTTQIGGSNPIYGAFGGYVTPGNLYC